MGNVDRYGPCNWPCDRFPWFDLNTGRTGISDFSDDYRIVAPAATGSATPVTNRASSLDSHMNAPLTSSGCMTSLKRLSGPELLTTSLLP